MRTATDRSESGWISILHLFTLSSFAIAQPLFDLIGKNPDFLVAQGAGPAEVVVLVLALIVPIPFLLTLVALLLGSIHRRLGQIAHATFIIVLVAMISMPVLKRADYGSDTLLLGTAIAVAVAFLLAYWRLWALRQAVTVASLTIVIFPFFFLFLSPVKQIVFVAGSTQDNSATLSKPTNGAPVLVVVFDELALTALMNEERTIDRSLFPNFYALSQDATWYRNATTVATSTTLAVPAILSGRYPREFRAATASNYPETLFSLLSPEYEILAFEPTTRVCPENSCSSVIALESTFLNRIRSLLTDIAAVYLHVVGTETLARQLPVVNQTWGDFWENDEQPEYTAPQMPRQHLYGGRDGQVQQFAESIVDSKKPRLYFIHLNLPHVPYEFLPSGRRYQGGWDVPGTDFVHELWGSEDWLITQAYQRFLLQVAATDTMLGKLLNRFRETGLYDRSLLVVVADHGVAFRPSSGRRGPPPMINLDQDILPIPLLVKYPTQREGVTTDRNVETIDILPTIADVLDVDIPWKTDGQSLLVSSVPPRATKTAYFGYRNFKRHESDALNTVKYETLNWKLSKFESGTSVAGLFRIGDFKEIIGKRTVDIPRSTDARLQWSLEQSELYRNVDPAGDFIPSHVTGIVHSTAGLEQPLKIAVVINHVVQAVTQTYQNRDSQWRFSAMVPEWAFRDGENLVTIHAIVRNKDDEISLTGGFDGESSAEGERYSLVTSDDGSLIKSADGQEYSIDVSRVKGKVELASARDGSIELFGWAIDSANQLEARHVIVFEDERHVFAGTTGMKRHVVHLPILVGFHFVVPLQLFRDFPSSNIRVFAVSKDGFTAELEYPASYPWREP